MYAIPDSSTEAVQTGLYSDDSYSLATPIGFTFSFYNILHTECVIGENGNIVFDSTLADQYDPWPIIQPLLGNTSVTNSICAPWCDLFMYGDISYFTTGTAPNRKFAINYCNVSFNYCDSYSVTSQIVLYETTNIIDVYIGHKEICYAWNGGLAIVGVQNAAGTAATAAPGRDYPSSWATTNEAWRFTPATGGTSYTVDSIPYTPIPYYENIYWYDSSTGTNIGTGDSITILTPTAPTTYMAIVTSCNDSATSIFDTTTGYFHLLRETSGVGILPPFNSLSVYPNPAHDILNIAADKTIQQVTISDLLGQTLLNLPCNSDRAEINTSTLLPGIYFIKINGSVMQRFVKE